MKKILSLFIIAVFSASAMLADDINLEQALQIACQFANSPETQQLSRHRAPAIKCMPQLAYSIKSKIAKEKDNVYVINLENDMGFIIVSGESGVGDEVLGYCDHGSFNYDDCPIQLKDLLKSYSDGIDHLRQNPSLASTAPRNTNSSIGSVVVGPLLTTTWNQWAPYNWQCPEGCPAGCYPVALAQVMNYWKWPKETQGELTNGEDFTGHFYDWDNMLDNYGSGYNSEQGDAVAQLMADIGKAFGTSYAHEGSATPFTAEPLVKNFCYQVHYETHKGTTAAELQKSIIKDLDEYYPVLYCGYGTDYGNYHALVCDGYTSKNYFHFNYGWGGQADGYYKNAISGFPYDASIFTKIRPYETTPIVIGNIKYGLLSDNTAEIIEYMGGGVNVDNGELEIPSTVEYEGNTYKVTRICKQSFFSKGNFSKMIIGDNIETVDPISFFYTNIDTLILSDKLPEVPNEAFAYTGVKVLTIGANIKRIGRGAFRMCRFSDVTSKSPAFEVDDEAFAHMYGTIANSEWLSCITSLGVRAFRAVRFKNVPYFGQLEKIAPLAFEGAFFPSNYTFRVPPTLRYIAPDAFYYCNVEGFVVDENNPYFAGHSYVHLLNKNKTSLIHTGKSNQPIMPNMCPYPETMVRMERGSIASRPRSTYYQGIYIPSTVIEMEGAFCYCETLSDLYCLASIPPVITDSTFNDKIFENSPDARLHVPKGTAELYKNAPGWRRFPVIKEDQEYIANQPQEREYYMVMHSGEESVSVPVSQVNTMSVAQNGDKHDVVVKLNDRDDIISDVALLDSITWMPGFVYENAEVFDLNDSILTAEAQKCTVQFDPTTISDPVQLCIRNGVLTPQVIDGVTRGLGIDISLSNDIHELSGTARITIPFSLSGNEKAHAAYYNEETGEWEPVLARYDEQQEAVVITTDHLSYFAVFTTAADDTWRTTLDLYYDLPPVSASLTENLEKLYKIVSDKDPEEGAIQAWRDDYGFWQSIGLDGGHNLLSAVGLSTDAIGEIVNKVGYVGTFATILDVIDAAVVGDDIGVASNTLKTILSVAGAQVSSVIGSSVMSASMGLTAFIGVALEKLGTKVHNTIKDLLRKAYDLYYSEEGRALVGPQYGSKYRNTREWFDYFYPAFSKKMTKESLEAYIEQSVRRYTEAYWEEPVDVFTMCMAEADVITQTTYQYPYESIQKEISEEYYAELMNGTLVSVFEAIKNKLAAKAAKEYGAKVSDYLKTVNSYIGLNIFDSSVEEGEESPYSGWTICYNDIPETIKDPQNWKKTLKMDGSTKLGAFTVYTMLKNKIKSQLTLIDKDGVEQAAYDFEIPAGKGLKVINIDLATGGVEIEVPHLIDLELTYDPAEIRGILKFSGTGRGLDVTWETEMETGIFLNNALLEKTRFQTEIERFFKTHNTISVDDSDNVFIGDDIVGRFDGNTATGSFTIDTTYPFEENTLEDIVRLVNNNGSLSMTYKHLLDGTIHHVINCQFTLTRESIHSKEYNITYSGEGNYFFDAKVVDKISNINFDQWPNGLQEITIDDITTKDVYAEGTVKLNYSKKLEQKD